MEDPQIEESNPEEAIQAPEVTTGQPPQKVTTFYEGAIGRVRLFMAILGCLAVIYGAIFHGWTAALGIFAGCAVSLLNFVWLKRVVSALADRMTNSEESSSGSSVVARFVFRYILIGAGAYVILHRYPGSLLGFLGGLLLPVPAIICEAGYELAVALRRGL